MDWNKSNKNPPEPDQKVYYFGPKIGIGIGHYKKAHVFTNLHWGIVDACDAPYWLPYDEKQAKSWVPIVPKKYTKNLYDN
jgi:hypothetical protein